MLHRKIKIKYSGFSLVEILVVMFIAAVAFMSFYSVATVGTKHIIESKNRLGAVALVNGRMEIIRNLAYDNVGIENSSEVPGNIPQEVPVVSNGRSYLVSTSIRYIDDPMDGSVESSPEDLIPNDYKFVTVTVSWNDSNGQLKSVSSSSRFVPPGLETDDGGSPLSINVTDGETLLPVNQASINISNDSISPTINHTITTSESGNVMLPSARISTDNHLTITKNGYETIETLDSSANFLPVYGHVSVASGFLNTYNYFLNKLSSLTIKSQDFQNNPIGNIEFSIGGGKIVGHDASVNIIYSMLNTLETTSTSGEKQFLNLSSGNYFITASPNAQYEFIDLHPSVTPFPLSSDNTEPYILRFADKSVDSLYLKIVDADGSLSPIADAKVTLTDGAVDVFAEKLSSLRGVVFYPDGPTSLESKTYTLKVQAEGYIDKSIDIDINGLTQVTINLAKI